uniref:Uncharacterized protein n=1 Tax=Arundo donax TaxID=35708 RepID=A0A0A9B2N9_ARUDO
MNFISFFLLPFAHKEVLESQLGFLVGKKVGVHVEPPNFARLKSTVKLQN